MLKPQDILVVLKLCSVGTPRPSIAALAADVGMAASEVHGAISRARTSGFLRHAADRSGASSGPGSAKTRFRPPQSDYPNATAIVEFLIHGLKYVFPAQRGELTRGIPTSYGAPPLNAYIAAGTDPVPVWPDAEGSERGIAFEPLYPTVPFAALRDPRLYELLAIADALREGRVRERKIAEQHLRQRLEALHVSNR